MKTVVTVIGEIKTTRRGVRYAFGAIPAPIRARMCDDISQGIYANRLDGYGYEFSARVDTPQALQECAPVFFEDLPQRIREDFANKMKTQYLTTFQQCAEVYRVDADTIKTKEEKRKGAGLCCTLWELLR